MIPNFKKIFISIQPGLITLIILSLLIITYFAEIYLLSLEKLSIITFQKQPNQVYLFCLSQLLITSTVLN